MNIQEEIKTLSKCNDELHAAANSLHSKIVERINSLDEGLKEIKQVASVSEGAEFYEKMADDTLGFDADKRNEAKANVDNLMSLTYGEHVWTGEDSGQ